MFIYFAETRHRRRGIDQASCRDKAVVVPPANDNVHSSCIAADVSSGGADYTCDGGADCDEQSHSPTDEVC